MNAREELLRVLKLYDKNESNVLAVTVKYGRWEDEKIVTNIDDLNFQYDDGYGGQELFGYILLDDTDWLERHEYDGAEWWEYKKCPTIQLLKDYIKEKEE